MGLTGGYFEFSAAHPQKEIPIIGFCSWKGKLEYWSGGVLVFDLPSLQHSSTPLLHSLALQRSILSFFRRYLFRLRQFLQD